MASQTTTIQGDVYINGNVAGKTMKVPAAAIADAQVAPLAGIGASKLEHQYGPTYKQAGGSNAAADRQLVHRVCGATAEIVSMAVGAIAAGTGTSSVVVDLLKNGASILLSTVTLTASTASFATIAPSGFTSPDLVAGDVLEVKVTSPSPGTGALAQGLFAQLTVREDAQ